VTRSSFERELNRLQQDLIGLGETVAQALKASVEVLLGRDLARARELIVGDAEINRRRFAIEADCLTLVATQQPMARDMRVLAAMLEIATELERTGDYAKGVARIATRAADRPLPDVVGDFRPMVAKVAEMLTASLQAFAAGDVAAARAIPHDDDEIDAYYNRVYRGLLQAMIADPGYVDEGSQLLWAAHNFERAGDRVTNICERVIFMVTGEMRELDSEYEAPPTSAAADGGTSPVHCTR
jgi:phosphate transport system protein